MKKIESWCQDKNSFALKLNPSYLSRLWDSIVVPSGCIGFSLDKPEYLFLSGRDMPLKKECYLSKQENFSLTFSVSQLVSKDGLSATVELTVLFYVPEDFDSLCILYSSFKENSSVFSLTEVTSRLQVPVEKFIQEYVKKHYLSDLLFPFLQSQQSQTFREKLNPSFELYGLKMISVEDIAVSSPQLQRVSRKSLAGEKLPQNAKSLLVLSKNTLSFFSLEDLSLLQKTHWANRPLGSLRSLSFVSNKSSQYLCLGAEKGVYLLSSEKEKETEAYPFSFPLKNSGGVNSCVLWGNYLYASHSQQGVVAWEIDTPTPYCHYLYPNFNGSEKTIRAIQESQGELYFASGRNVYSFFPGKSELFCSLESPCEITSVAVSTHWVWAGNSQGEVWQRAKKSPGSQKLIWSGEKPIYSLKLSSGILWGSDSKDTFVYKEGKFEKLELSESVRGICLGEGEIFAGISPCQHKVYLWQDLSEKPRELSFSEKILDICFATRKDAF